ncbi:hypothetical protein OBBRIDRAFT_864227 [Obba rivulosa]|uniref:Prolyl 4-hydroxylase alpha subunit Fe(2+) 2OG dioxygenase domain-containing protein n=1 Tax=Obba rivulosa TaxID=1052685 RepID=A0A8E2B2H1_9APHY|nr:hypothetical protein OBBRIDRAFT_864227 [Obba rivulosa]
MHIGPGGFFKSHVDNPHSETMFGSLVFVLPTTHDGNAPVFRHNSTERTFDSGKLLADISVSYPLHHICRTLQRRRA